MNFLTIKDIARRARVSHTTVSRVLNNKPGVKRATKERILDLIRELDYQPNLVARSLVMKRSRTLGLVITTIRNPFYLEVAQGVEDTARARGYSVFFCCTNFSISREEESIRDLRRKGVDGIILSSAHTRDPYVASLVEQEFPTVLVNRRVLEPDLAGKMDYIGVDNVKAGEMAVDHLLQVGRRRVAVISGNKDSSITIERMKGIRRALKKHHVELDDEMVFEGDYLKKSGYDGALYFLSRTGLPDAILCLNDYMALGVYDALMERGVSIPETVSLMGFNDIEFSSLQVVGLTTISQKNYLLGSMAVQRLVDRVEGAKAGVEYVLEPELIVRKTCGHVRSGLSNYTGIREGG